MKKLLLFLSMQGFMISLYPLQQAHVKTQTEPEMKEQADAQQQEMTDYELYRVVQKIIETCEACLPKNESFIISAQQHVGAGFRTYKGLILSLCTCEGMQTSNKNDQRYICLATPWGQVNIMQRLGHIPDNEAALFPLEDVLIESVLKIVELKTLQVDGSSIIYEVTSCQGQKLTPVLLLSQRDELRWAAFSKRYALEHQKKSS